MQKVFDRTISPGKNPINAAAVRRKSQLLLDWHEQNQVSSGRMPF
jgi:hypothetical protein